MTFSLLAVESAFPGLSLLIAAFALKLPMVFSIKFAHIFAGTNLERPSERIMKWKAFQPPVVRQ